MEISVVVAVFLPTNMHFWEKGSKQLKRQEMTTNTPDSGNLVEIYIDRITPNWLWKPGKSLGPITAPIIFHRWGKFSLPFDKTTHIA